MMSAVYAIARPGALDALEAPCEQLETVVLVDAHAIYYGDATAAVRIPKVRCHATTLPGLLRDARA